MANTATAQSPIPLGHKASGLGIYVTPIVVSFDTTGADLTVYNPADDAYFAVVGWQYCEALAHNVTIKSEASTLVTYEMAANTGITHPLGAGVLFTGVNKGDALVMQVSAQPITMLVYVQEFKQLTFF